MRFLKKIRNFKLKGLKKIKLEYLQKQKKYEDETNLSISKTQKNGLTFSYLSEFMANGPDLSEKPMKIFV